MAARRFLLYCRAAILLSTGRRSQDCGIQCVPAVLWTRRLRFGDIRNRTGHAIGLTMQGPEWL